MFCFVLFCFVLCGGVDDIVLYYIIRKYYILWMVGLYHVAAIVTWVPAPEATQIQRSKQASCCVPSPCNCKNQEEHTLFSSTFSLLEISFLWNNHSFCACGVCERYFIIPKWKFMRIMYYSWSTFHGFRRKKNGNIKYFLERSWSIFCAWRQLPDSLGQTAVRSLFCFPLWTLNFVENARARIPFAMRIITVHKHHHEHDSFSRGWSQTAVRSFPSHCGLWILYKTSEEIESRTRIFQSQNANPNFMTSPQTRNIITEDAKKKTAAGKSLFKTKHTSIARAFSVIVLAHRIVFVPSSTKYFISFQRTVL